MLQSGLSPVGAFFFLIPVIASLLFAASAAVAAMGAVSLRTMTEQADLIIYGKVDSLATEEHPFQPEANGEMQGRTLYRVLASVSAIEAVKGRPPDRRIVVTTFPGMEDQPVFHRDEHVILFLVSNEGGESYSTYARLQGKFDVSDGQVIRAQQSVQDFLIEVRSYIPATK